MRILALLCLAAWLAHPLFAQEEADVLTAKERLFPNIGPGLRGVKVTPDGNTYVLTAPSASVSVFGKDRKLLMDVDAAGTVYVADRAANAVKIWDAQGNARMVNVTAPISVAALPDGEVAVATLREPHLVIVFDKKGRDVREFGDPEQLTERLDLNRFLNIGQLAADAAGHLFYAYSYMPEPTVRQYDRAGYAAQDMQYTALEAAPEAQAVRHEIQRQEKKSSAPVFKRVLTGAGVDADSGEVWMVTGNNLHRFDKDGTRRASYKLYTPAGARLEASIVDVLRDYLVLGNDPQGIYIFDRPDKKNQQ